MFVESFAAATVVKPRVLKTTLLYPLALCAFSVALEGLFAGGDIRRRLKDLRSPSYSVPFWGWVIIGGLYYAICFALLYRLFRLPGAFERNTAFALLGAFMFINALWNYFFFRSRNLFHAFLLGLPYNAIAISLFLLLLRVDRPGAWWLLPYLIYLLYANIWSYRLWRMNPPTSS